MLFNGLDNSPKLPLPLSGSGPNLTLVPWTHPSQPPNSISTLHIMNRGQSPLTHSCLTSLQSTHVEWGPRTTWDHWSRTS